MQFTRLRAALVATVPAAVVLVPAVSQAAPQIGPEILLTTHPGLPTSEVAGMPGLQYSADLDEGFEEILGSPNGNWIVRGPIDDPNSPSDFIDVLVVNGVAEFASGDVAPWDPGGRRISRIEFNGYDINDSGDYTCIVGLTGVPFEQQTIRKTGGQFFVEVEPGAPVPTIPGASFRSRQSEARIHADGTIAFVADDLQGVPSSRDTAFFQSDALLLQSGVSVPPGQGNGETATFLDSSGSRSFWVGQDAQSWAMEGFLNVATTRNEVFIVNGDVVLQEGFVIPGSGFSNPIRTNGIFGGFMDDGGNWYARGKNDVDDIAWLVRNGVVIAREGDPVVPGSTELAAGPSSSTIFGLITGNSRGQYVYSVDTDFPDNDRDEVLVRDGVRIVARIGDPLDLDRNGAFDDDAFIEAFVDRNGHLDDNGFLRVQVEVIDGAGDDTGWAILRIDTNGDQIGTNDCTANPNSTGFPSGLTARGSTSAAANDVTLVASGLPIFQFGIFLNADQAGFVPDVGANGSGNLCLGGGIGRYNRPGEILSSGATGSFELTLDLTAIPRPSSIESAAAGQTWRFQAWYRDTNASGPTSNLTRGLEITFD